MKESLKTMANGDYTQTIEFPKKSNEIKEMFTALANLKKSLQGAVEFSNELGKMNLNATHAPKSKNDLLGSSLIAMRDKLLEFRNKEKVNRILTKKLLFDGLEEERKRLSRELHDGIGPLLTSLKFYIENRIADTNQKKEMKEIVDTTISEIRLMSSALRPTSIDDFGVGPTLTNYVKSLENSININIKFEDSTNTGNSKISNNQGTNIFRICQELVNNSIKHAEAKNITITLSEFDNFVALFYFDDGKGFDVKKVTLGSGITNIYERVEICDGTIQIESNKHKTTFEIEIPLII